MWQELPSQEYLSLQLLTHYQQVPLAKEEHQAMSTQWWPHSSTSNSSKSTRSKWTRVFKWTRWIKWIQSFSNSRWSIKCNTAKPTLIINRGRISKIRRIIRRMMISLRIRSRNSIVSLTKLSSNHSLNTFSKCIKTWMALKLPTQKPKSKNYISNWVALLTISSTKFKWSMKAWLTSKGNLQTIS